MRDRAGEARGRCPLWVFVVLALFAFAAPANAFAGAKAIAVYVEGPDAKRTKVLKAAVLEAIGSDVPLAGDKTFGRELLKAGQRGPLRAAIDGKAVEGMRKAMSAVGADGVLIVRERRDRRSRWVLWTMLDASDDEGEVHKLPLDPKSRAKDADEIAAAIAPSLERYKPQPEPTPAPPTPAPAAEEPASPPPAESAASAAGAGGAGMESAARAPVSAPVPPRDTPAQWWATSVLDLGVGGQASGRHVVYRNGIAPKPAIYVGFPQLAARASARIFPLAPLRGPWGDIGLEADYSRVFLRKADLQGAFSTTTPMSYLLGLCARIRPGEAARAVLGVCVDYALTYYGPLGPPTSETPDVSYRSVRPVLETRVAFGAFALSAVAAGRILVDPGDISTRVYNPKGLGFDAEVGAAWMFVRRLEARIYGRYERYSLTLTPPAKTQLGKGMVDDQLYGMGLALALVL